MSDDKPREWWVAYEPPNNLNDIFEGELPSKEEVQEWIDVGVYSECVGLIEKSAYERLQSELAQAKKEAFQWEAECGHALGRNGMRLIQERDELKAEVERLKDRCEKLRVGHEAMSSNDQMTFGHLYIETERLKLLAENHSAILQKLVDRHWFDRTQIENHYLACSLCDCGNSGEKINTDGHDYDCAISLARQALADKEREDGK